MSKKTKSEILKLRITRQDKLQLQSKAKESGKTLSDFVRDKVAKDWTYFAHRVEIENHTTMSFKGV